MKKFFCFFLFLCLISTSVFAHPGGTDARGGHYVRTPGWGYSVGSYHYHDGEYITEIKNGIPQVEVFARAFPSKLYIDETSTIKVDMPDRYRNSLQLIVDDENIIKLYGDEITALDVGKTILTAYINKDSYDTCEVEVFPYPEEIITLTCSQKFILTGRPFTINYDVEYITDKNAPLWDRKPTLDWSSYYADIFDDNTASAEVVCDMPGEQRITVNGKYGGYAFYDIKVYSIKDVLLWVFILLFVVALFISVTIMIVRRKRRQIY